MPTVDCTVLVTGKRPYHTDIDLGQARRATPAQGNVHFVDKTATRTKADVPQPGTSHLAETDPIHEMVKKHWVLPVKSLLRTI
ncbi:hypothetical protein FA95DRAFT_1558679 [Auriscalpium vulgare]|uniref:Uncharacterized protein n=1 Tax=Auriscalpium vulgare TaxID=40419 RepID=A0ACB8RW81_9AGAM|nr:hypothetical protein FA95DRAFT_1558679 [Auriscalpium vulgare]